MSALLKLTSITKSFGAVRALKGISFDLQAGEVHALLGENGAGKSTLIKVITGAHQPDSGTFDINGQRITHLTPTAAHQLGIACIYQQPALFPDLAVAENIGIRLEENRPLARVNWAPRRKHASELLQRIGADISPDASVRSLSMPEQQLVEIACAIGAGARAVIMDEPTASLTQTEVESLFAVVRELRESGVGLIYISHRLEEIFALADRVTVLRDGETVGTRRVRHDRPIETSNDGERQDHGKAASAPHLSESELIQLMVGREVSSIYPTIEAGPAESVLSVRNLGCSASGVKNVTLEVRAGEVVGLAGLVGAGRTEFARVLFGLTPADAGEIELDGRNVRITSPPEAVAQGIAYVPEDRRRHGVILEMPIAHNVTMAIHRRLFPGTWIREKAERAITLDYIRDLDVRTAGPAAPGGSLSGGNQQKIALARWLATKPKLLILDEPTQGVDIGAKSEIHKLIRRLAGEGMAVLMISSDLTEIVGMSDRIAVMRGGSIVEMMPGGSDAQDVMAAALGQQPGGLPDIGRGSSKAIPPVRGNKSTNEEGRQKEDRNTISREAAECKHPDIGVRSSFGLRTSVFEFFSRYSRELSVAAALILLLLLLAIFAPNFFEPQPLLSRLASAAPKLVLACGVALVIICRQIDISIGSLFAVCGTCAGLAAAAGAPFPVAILMALVAGAAGGAFNGILTAALRLPSIVVTLATMVTLREALRLKQQGVFINLPEGTQWFGLPMIAGQLTVCGIALGLVIMLSLALKHLAGGRFIYAVGSDAEAARLAGLRPRWVTFLVFVLMGVLTGVAAVLNLVQSPQVDPNSGRGLELEAIAAAVVGGVAISGGRGRIWGVFVGLLLLVCIGPALTYVGVEPYWEKAIQGTIILLAVVSEGLRGREEST